MKKIKCLIILSIIPFLLFSQNNVVLSVIEKSPILGIPQDFEEIEFIDSIKYNSFINDFHNYLSKDYAYYTVSNEKVRSDLSNIPESMKFTFNDVPMAFYTRIHVLGKINLNEQYESLVLRVELPDDITIAVYNYNKQGYLLSSFNILGYLNRYVWAQVTQQSSCTLDSNRIFNKTKEGDFILKQKIILDETGHFKITEITVEDY